MRSGPRGHHKTVDWNTATDSNNNHRSVAVVTRVSWRAVSAQRCPTAVGVQSITILFATTTTPTTTPRSEAESRGEGSTLHHECSEVQGRGAKEGPGG